MGIVNTGIKQKTIKNDVSLKGVGLHTGKDVTLTFKPAPENTGFAFKRIDLEGAQDIQTKVMIRLVPGKHWWLTA